MHSLALVIPTFNRADQLSKTLESIKIAEKPTQLPISVYLVDNNSTKENTEKYKALVQLYSSYFSIHYLSEPKQGRSNALNRGIAEAEAEFVGFIDDDESIDISWFTVIHNHLQNEHIDYLGGPYKPDWEATPPAWLPANVGAYRGILGWIELAEKCISYDDFDGELCGGNCVIKRSIFTAISGFNNSLGRSAKNLMGGEDGEFHRRLKAHKYFGLYDPNLVIYHQIPKSRMTFRYHFRWAFWSGVSNGIRLKTNPLTAEPVPKLWGVPRYWYQKALQGVSRFLFNTLSLTLFKNPNGICGALDALYLLGLFYGKNLKHKSSFT